jgi:hypothetical protein
MLKSFDEKILLLPIALVNRSGLDTDLALTPDLALTSGAKTATRLQF